VFTATRAGVYTVVAEGFPYKPIRTQITVTKSTAETTAEQRKTLMWQIEALERQQARSIRS